MEKKGRRVWIGSAASRREFDALRPTAWLETALFQQAVAAADTAILPAVVQNKANRWGGARGLRIADFGLRIEGRMAGPTGMSDRAKQSQSAVGAGLKPALPRAGKELCAEHAEQSQFGGASSLRSHCTNRGLGGLYGTSDDSVCRVGVPAGRARRGQLPHPLLVARKAINATGSGERQAVETKTTSREAPGGRQL